MSEMPQEYVKELARRTLVNYEFYVKCCKNPGYEVSLALNSLLSLLVIPIERNNEFKNGIDSILLNYGSKRTKPWNGKQVPVCESVRNGIAHGHLEFEALNNEITKLIIKNGSDYKNNFVNEDAQFIWQIEASGFADLLKELCDHIIEVDKE
jgi:hypothetical protein